MANCHARSSGPSGRHRASRGRQASDTRSRAGGWRSGAQPPLALGAHLILGINLEANQATVARAEARAFLKGIGRSLITGFELGNEPEVYGTPARRVRTRRRRPPPALGWPGREPAAAPEALARMPATGTEREPERGSGREPEPGSGREIGPPTWVAVGGGPSARLLHAAALAGGRRLPGDGASASAHGAGHPGPRHAEPSAPGQNAPTVHAGDAAPRRSNRSRCRPCRPGSRGCDPSRASSVCTPCRLDRPRT